MENEFLDKVEDNAAVRIWSEKMQLEKGDSLTEDDEVKQLFYCNYGDLHYLLNIKVHLVLTVEEYTSLLRYPRIQADKAYSRAVNVPTFVRKLMSITRMSEQWVTARIKQKGESKCIPWKSLRDLILTHPDMKKRFDVFALSIYGLIIFPKALGHVDEAVSDLFDRLDKRVTPVPAILAKTFISLNACRRTSEGRFIGCAKLLLAWFHSHFWKIDKVSYRVFSENYSPLKELMATPRQDDISEEKWIAILQNLQDED
ncbi:hypothetical protein Gotri_027630, partial [Gossypium trilobum]|nr:hypothetical protein [Gossypium trilobum]